MTEQDFSFICKFLQERSAIVLEPGKEYLVESRLTPLAQELQLGTLEKLLAQLRSQPHDSLSKRVLEALVTTETSFFRDHFPFETLRLSVLPELLTLNRATKQLNIWCAACSTGQEPYSLAILLREHFLHLVDWRIQLFASDISTEMLARASEAKYNQTEVNRGLPPKLLTKYFEQQGANWQLKNELRRVVTFRQINLAGAWPSFPPLDLVLLRNVMIYFDVETKKNILAKLTKLLKPEGYLILGGAETTLSLDERYRRIETLRAGFYQWCPKPQA